MADTKESLPKQIFDKLLDMLKNLPWMDIVIDAGKMGFSLLQGSGKSGMYEVLEYESTLEIHDVEGKRATYHKRQKVRYLQDNIIAYQDQAWGDGEILHRYRCSPGKMVDHYRIGHKTYILISLREVKNRGSKDEFHISRQIRNGFLRKQEQWETDISHPTRRLVLRVIFPENRPPLRTSLVENTTQKSTQLGDENRRQLPKGRWLVSWQTNSARLNERYILKWSW